MRTYLWIIEIIVWVEMLLILSIVMTTYVVKAFLFYKKKRETKKISLCEKYVEKIVRGDSNTSVGKMPRNFRRLNILLTVVNDRDKVDKTMQWPLIRASIIEYIILPRARVAYKKRWKKRLYSIRAFELMVTESDEKIVMQLLNDPVPLITFHAGFVAVSLATREIVIKLIMKMAAERRLAQTIYLQSFAHAADKVFEIVVDYLSEVKDGYVRAACYRALMFSKKDYYFPQEEDLYSANIELRISATKYLGKLPSKKAIDLLGKMISDNLWQVRAIAVTQLGKIGSAAVVKYLAESLHDKSWWVRINAANALKDIGEVGINVLQNVDPEIDRYAYEVSQHVLHNLITVLGE